MLCAIIIGIALDGAISTAPSPREHQLLAPQPVTSIELQLELRHLWTGHVFWVRSVVIASHYNDTAAAEVAEARAVANARDLADSIRPFYGQEAADKLFGLLAGHYGAIKQYMQATNRESPEGQEDARKAIFANAKGIAAFLDAANPYLPEASVLPLLSAHGAHHMSQIDALHQRDYTREAAVWEAMLSHIHTVADAMAGALTKQFPDKVVG